VEFKVDQGALAEMAGELMGLTKEFEGLDDVVEGYESAVGHDGLAGKLDDFATNWSDKRREMVKAMEAIAGYADAAADAYGETETELTGAIDKVHGQIAGAGNTR
jgi:hypothetical protein